MRVFDIVYFVVLASLEVYAVYLIVVCLIDLWKRRSSKRK